MISRNSFDADAKALATKPRRVSVMGAAQAMAARMATVNAERFIIVSYGA